MVRMSRSSSGLTMKVSGSSFVSPGARVCWRKQKQSSFSKLSAACPGETKELPLTFIVKPELDRDVRTITLSYAFFNLSEEKLAASDRVEP